MFVKTVVVLLLLIVLVSLLRGGTAPVRRQPAGASRTRRLMLRVALFLLVVASAVIAYHLLDRPTSGPVLHATDITGADFARLADLEALSDAQGRRVASADFTGKAVVVFFGYTRCPDICPTTLIAMKEAMRLLGAEADRVQVLFVTVDPERDTAAVLADYVPWFDPRFRGLRGDEETTRRIAAAFHVFYAKVPGDTALGYSIDHSATSYAYDPQGQLRLLIRHGESAANIAADLRLLLAGK